MAFHQSSGISFDPTGSQVDPIKKSAKLPAIQFLKLPFVWIYYFFVFFHCCDVIGASFLVARNKDLVSQFLSKEEISHFQRRTTLTGPRQNIPARGQNFLFDLFDFVRIFLFICSANTLFDRFSKHTWLQFGCYLWCWSIVGLDLIRIHIPSQPSHAGIILTRVLVLVEQLQILKVFYNLYFTPSIHHGAKWRF